MEETSRTVARLVGQFIDGDIQLPEIQRNYVWTKEKVRALVDSIYKGYPSGSILLWETASPVQTHSPAAAEAGSTAKASTLLLDGQQRITSLAAVTTGTPIRMKVGGSVKTVTIDICFNMDHPEALPDSDSQDDEEGDDGDAADHRIFRLAGRTTAGDPRWIPITEVFKKGDATALFDNGIKPTDPNLQKYLARLARLSKLKEYKYPVQILEKGTPYSEVTDIFVRLNSQGVNLRRSDLALAHVTSRWTGAMDLFTETADECRQKGFDIDEGFLIKCLMSVSTDQNKFKSVDKIDTARLEKDWVLTRRGLFFAIDFFKDAGIETTDVLPSLFLLVPVVRLAVKNGFAFGRDMESKILRWLYAALIWGRYSRGATETMLDEDLALIRDSADPLAAMLERVRRQSGRIEVKAEDLAGKTKKSSLFKMMYIAAKKAGAKDWGSGLALGIDAEHGFKAMHRQVFSRADVVSALRKRHGPKEAGRMAGDIANMVFSLGHVAGTAGGRPAEYLQAIADKLGPGALDSQCVPDDPNMWSVDRYEEFLAKRREGLAAAINGLLESPGRSRRRRNAPPPDDLAIIGGGESQTVEFKSSMLYDYRLDRKNPALRSELLKEIAALMNADGGIIYVGVADDGKILGIERDYKLAGRRASWDVWLQSLVNVVKSLGAAEAKNVSYEKVKIEGKAVAKITVRKGAGPAYIGRGREAEFAVREGPTSRWLGTKEAHEYIRARFPGHG